MSYTIRYSDTGKADISIGTTNDESHSITLLARNVANYGQVIATTQLHMLENFANQAAPSGAIEGQLWYDNANGRLNVSTTDDPATADWHSVITSESGTWDDVVRDDDITDVVRDADITNVVRFDANRDIGSSSTKYRNVYATTFQGKATSAQYADLAERFQADDVYEIGTVVKIGGPNEVTHTTSEFDNDVFGVVSENPAFLMNDGAGNDETHPPVAFAGRVQVKVTGPVKKGHRLVSSEMPGVAVAPTRQEQSTRMSPFNVIGRALETSTDTGVSLVWVAVGAK